MKSKIRKRTQEQEQEQEVGQAFQHSLGECMRSDS